MKKRFTYVGLLTAIFSIATLQVGCGEAGTQFPPFPQGTLNYDFRILSSTPTNGSNSISTATNTVQIYFSEPINPQTIPNNIKVVAGQTGTTFTDPEDFVIQGSVLGVQITQADLAENQTYHVVFFPGLESENNNAIYNGEYAQGVSVSFNTGTGYGNSQVGPPHVVSVDRYSMGNGCFGAIITFNEDVNLLTNDVRIEKKSLFINNWTQIISVTTPLYSWASNVWVTQGSSCSPNENAHRVIVQAATDLDGEAMTAPHTSHCESSVNIFNGPGQCN